MQRRKKSIKECSQIDNLFPLSRTGFIGITSGGQVDGNEVGFPIVYTTSEKVPFGLNPQMVTVRIEVSKVPVPTTGDEAEAAGRKAYEDIAKETL